MEGQQKDNINAVEIFAGTAFEAGFVKTMLEDAGIEVYFKDEHIGRLNPWWAAPGGAGAVKLVISSLDTEKALPIIREYERNQQTG